MKNKKLWNMASIFAWQSIVKETVGIALVWGAYLVVSTLIQDPSMKDSAPGWFSSALVFIFWAGIVITVLSGILVSIKSALPAAIAWILILPLYLLGFTFAAKIALISANVSVVLYAIGFALHGGRLNESEPG